MINLFPSKFCMCYCQRQTTWKISKFCGPWKRKNKLLFLVISLGSKQRSFLSYDKILSQPSQNIHIPRNYYSGPSSQQMAPRLFPQEVAADSGFSVLRLSEIPPALLQTMKTRGVWSTFTCALPTATSFCVFALFIYAIFSGFVLRSLITLVWKTTDLAILRGKENLSLELYLEFRPTSFYTSSAEVNSI